MLNIVFTLHVDISHGPLKMKMRGERIRMRLIDGTEKVLLHNLVGQHENDFPR